MSPQPREPTRRLFFALWPSEAERRALAAATQAVLEAAQGRPIAPANLHLTLAFLGEVAVSRGGELGELGRQVAAAWHAPAPVLVFEQVAYWRRPQILCVLEREACAAVAALAAALRSAAAGAGFTPDLKPFHAHVTVARKVASALPVTAIAQVTWRCEACALIESRTSAVGASVYSVLESQPLGKAKKVHEKH